MSPNSERAKFFLGHFKTKKTLMQIRRAWLSIPRLSLKSIDRRSSH